MGKRNYYANQKFAHNDEDNELRKIVIARNEMTKQSQCGRAQRPSLTFF